MEQAMTDPMHPQHNEARKAVEAADEAYVGTPGQISKLVSEAAQRDMKQDITVFGGSATEAEKAGLAAEMTEEGSLIQQAVAASESEEKAEKGETWEDSPFAPGSDL